MLPFLKLESFESVLIEITEAVDESIFRGRSEPLVEFDQFGWTPESTNCGGDSQSKLIKTLSFYKTSPEYVVLIGGHNLLK